MSLLDHIDRLQKAPLHIRKTALVISVIVFMSVIIGLWMLELRASAFGRGPQALEPFRVVWESLRGSIRR